MAQIKHWIEKKKKSSLCGYVQIGTLTIIKSTSELD